jgi:hypothetical protein
LIFAMDLPAPNPSLHPAPIFQVAKSRAQEDQKELALELEGLLDDVAGPAGKRGNYTAERFREREPRRYELIVSGLVQGYSKQSISRAVGVAWETVRAVEKAELGKSILEEKKGFADGLADVIELGIDGLKVKAKEGKLSALDVAVLTDKFLVLRGEASAIIETRGEDPSVVAYREFMRAMGSQAADVLAKGPAGGPAARAVGGPAAVWMGERVVSGGVQPLALEVETVDVQQP